MKVLKLPNQTKIHEESSVLLKKRSFKNTRKVRSIHEIGRPV